MDGVPIASIDGLVSGLLFSGARSRSELPLLACIHGGGCNGRYFDLKGSSMLAASLARGFSVLLVNRPGYGGNRPAAGANPIADTAPLIKTFIEQCRVEHVPEAAGVAIVGHSIGGAIALTIAAQRGDWPLRSVAVSGIGDEPPFRVSALEGVEGDAIEAPQELSDALFYDPERALKWQAVLALRAVAEPWLVPELTEVISRWPREWRTCALDIDVPIHLRLAEHERIWTTGAGVVARMAAAFERSPCVDAALLLGGGHLYDATVNAPVLFDSQLEFIALSARKT